MALLGTRVPETLSVRAVEALALLADCEQESVNAYGLSKVATAGTPGSEWRLTTEFQEAIRSLAAHDLIWHLPSVEDRRTSEECWHWRFDHQRIRARLARERAEIVPLECGPRRRPSALAL